jgi:hypothetical protein
MYYLLYWVHVCAVRRLQFSLWQLCARLHSVYVLIMLLSCEVLAWQHISNKLVVISYLSPLVICWRTPAAPTGRN